MFIKDKYTPVIFDEYQIYKSTITKLNNLKSDIPNLLFYGDGGNGKTTIINSLINNIYNSKLSISKQIIKLKVNKMVKDIEINSSNVHFEINLNKYCILNNKNYLLPLIKLLTQFNEVNMGCEYKIIVIKNIHYIKHSLIYLKNIIEKKYSNLRFILTTTCLNYNLNTVLSMFTLIKIIPTKHDIYNLCKFILKNENTTYPEKKLLKLIDNENTNILKTLIKLELCLINKVKYIDPVDKIVDSMHNYIINSKLDSIVKLRELIYESISKNICIELIMSKLYRKFSNDLKLDNNMKINITSLFAEYDVYIKNSFKNVIHLETLVVILLNLFIIYIYEN